MSSMQRPRTGLKGIQKNGMIYVFGGCKFDGVEIFDFKNSSWADLDSKFSQFVQPGDINSIQHSS